MKGILAGLAAAGSSLFLLLTACALVQSLNGSGSRSGHVSGALLEAPPAERYETQPGVRYDLPVPLSDNAEPTYPSAMLSQHIPITMVRVRLMVDDEGHVYRMQSLGHIEETEQIFFAAVQTAVLKWQFFPLVKVTDGPGNTVVTVAETSTNYAGQAAKLPFHQDYAFSFEQVDGKGVVRKVP